MFAQHAVEIRRPSSEVVSTLLAPGCPWTLTLDGDGSRQLARVGVRVGDLPVYKHVELEVGTAAPGPHGDRLMLPVTWHAVGGPPIFPRMEGTLHVEPAPAGTTTITLNASYDPPLGRLGDLIDRVVMHRVAAETVRDFLERVALTLAAHD